MEGILKEKMDAESMNGLMMYGDMDGWMNKT